MNLVDEKLSELIAAIKQSDVFAEYEETKEILKEDPELKKQVDEYRAKIFSLQNMEDDGHLGERIEAFAEEKLYLTSQPKVRSFLDAELALCRLLQEVTDEIVESMNFE